MFRVTPLVRNLIIINVVVFLAQMLLDGNNLLITRMLSLAPIRSDRFAAYQLFTYMFAHGGPGHIFFNMLALASFAPVLESYWGDKKFLIFYLATGLGAGVIYAGINFFLSPGAGGFMLGASGAIYGILMAFGMLFPNMELSIFFVFPIKAKYLVFVLGFITYAMDRSGEVAHTAHFGGALIAFFLISYWRSQGKGKGW
jgi:membrane associated rhomboid family serine protease